MTFVGAGCASPVDLGDEVIKEDSPHGRTTISGISTGDSAGNHGRFGVSSPVTSTNRCEFWLLNNVLFICIPFRPIMKYVDKS
jgi:hypothetical protein